MVDINEILKLPKVEQVAIADAIRENMEDGTLDMDELSQQQIEFIRKRVDDIESGNHKNYSWDEVKTALSNKWNT